jgi:hypothetical protein
MLLEFVCLLLLLLHVLIDLPLLFVQRLVLTAAVAAAGAASMTAKNL